MNISLYWVGIITRVHFSCYNLRINWLNGGLTLEENLYHNKDEGDTKYAMKIYSGFGK